MKNKSERKIIGEFFGLTLKMYSMKNIDGKKSNTAKEVKSVMNSKTLFSTRR